ncbi:MAG: asparagine synthase (glutamine-hydrolyzing) [Nitrospirales bacterium]
MCGLAGIFQYRTEAPPVNQAELLCIRETMMSRGPDGAGLWLAPDRGIGLAHRRLAIIDLSEAGAQPMVDAQTGNRIVFNGEIYNYRELRAELSAIGVSFHSHSDTEVLLKLYALQGREMLGRLRGMFAFALWDEKKQGLLLARDPFGIKPLYIADNGKTLRFASQVKALLAGGNVDTVPEPAGHVGFFLWGHVPEPYTLYRGIRALPAGESLWLDRAGHKEVKSFFDLSAEMAASIVPLGSMPADKAREQLRGALFDSVRCHLLADVPVGTFLSAGLDSTTIAALAREAGVAERVTLTLGFKEFAGTDKDEVPLAELVARHYGTTHHTRWVNKEAFAASLGHLFDVMDQPSIDGVNSYFVCQAAHDAGLKVALSGLGGDELFAGYSDFQKIPRMVDWLSPVARIPGLGAGFRRISAPLLKHFTSPKLAGLLEYGGDYAGAYLLRRGLFMPWELPDVLDGDLVRAGWRDLHTLPSLELHSASVSDPRLKISALETVWYMRNQLLRDTDWASMAHSLEVRVPLVDVELFRTVTRLIHAGFPPGKQDMAASPSTPLPQSVLHRHKTGFSVPVREWLMAAQDASSSPGPGLRKWATFVYQRQSSVKLGTVQ